VLTGDNRKKKKEKNAVAGSGNARLRRTGGRQQRNGHPPLSGGLKKKSFKCTRGKPKSLPKKKKT